MFPMELEKRRTWPLMLPDPLRRGDWFTDGERLFDHFFANDKIGGWYPADIWEDQDSLHVELEMPSMTRDDIQVGYEDGLLKIEGEKKPPEHDVDYHLAERRYGKFVRTFHLGNVVDPDSIEATFKDGVLTVTLAKRPETKARKIKIACE